MQVVEQQQVCREVAPSGDRQPVRAAAERRRARWRSCRGRRPRTADLPGASSAAHGSSGVLGTFAVAVLMRTSQPVKSDISCRISGSIARGWTRASGSTGQRDAHPSSSRPASPQPSWPGSWRSANAPSSATSTGSPEQECRCTPSGTRRAASRCSGPPRPVLPGRWNCDRRAASRTSAPSVGVAGRALPRCWSRGERKRSAGGAASRLVESFQSSTADAEHVHGRSHRRPGSPESIPSTATAPDFLSLAPHIEVARAGAAGTGALVRGIGPVAASALGLPGERLSRGRGA